MEYRKNEKGVALLLALGFAALLLVLIMGFATNALIERKVASNNGDKTQARSLAMSALNRAIVAMQYLMISQTTPPPSSTEPTYDEGLFRFDNIVSKRDNATSAEVFSDSDLESMFYKLATDRYLFKYRDNFYIYEYPKKDDFDYGYNDNGETVTADKFNKMRRPQWQFVKNTDSTPQIIGRFWYAVLPDVGRVYMNADGSSTSSKTGYSIKEFDPLQFSANLKRSDSDFDFEHTGQWSARIAADSSLAFKDRAFWVFNSIEPEKSSEAENKRNTYYRDSADGFSKKIFYVLDKTKKASDLLAAVDALNGNSTLAANIIGMFNNTIQSSEFVSDSADWETTLPTYTGNMLTPYLSEIEVKLENIRGTITDNGDTDADGVNEYSIVPQVDVVISFELYDPFNRGYKDTSKIVVKDFVGSIQFMNDTTVASTKTIDDFSAAVQTVTTNGKYHTVSVTIPITGDAISGESGFKVKARLNDFSGSWIYKRPIADDNPALISVDCVKGLAKDPGAEYGVSGELTINSTALGTPGGTPNVFSAQASDPLNNLEHTLWTIGTDNTGFIPNPIFADDKLSPYVKGDANSLPTLADLRYVSSGESGKTLDIISAHKALLDQLTTLNDTDPQLIDINTRSVKVWMGLIAGVTKLDGNPLWTTAGDDLKVAKAVSKIIRRDKKFFKKRSDFIEVLSTALSESSLTDVDSPLLVGKMISLCKTEDYPEYVHLIVVAQTIKDNQGLGTVGTYDAEHDEITSEVRYLVKLRRKPDYTMEIISIEELVD